MCQPIPEAVILPATAVMEEMEEMEVVVVEEIQEQVVSLVVRVLVLAPEEGTVLQERQVLQVEA